MRRNGAARGAPAQAAEFVYFDRDTGVPSFLAGAVRKYTAAEAAEIEKNLAGCGLSLRPVTPLDRVMLALGREALSSHEISRVTFKGRRGYHEHLNGVRGFLAMARNGGGDPRCFREDGSPMFLVIIDGELKYKREEAVWPRSEGANGGGRSIAKKGGRKKCGQ